MKLLLQLLHCISFFLFSGNEGYNPLVKLGRAYELITARFHTVYYPGKAICIDEGMIPFRGKAHMRVYAPDKPAKYGLKSYQVYGTFS